MATNQKQFLISVADALLFDSNDNLVLNGQTLIDTSITSEIQTQDIFGGFGAKLQYTYSYQKTLNATINDSVWNEQYIAINSGSEILNELKDVVTSESITLVSDNGTLAETPVGDIYVIRANGAIQTITPTDKDFTVVGGGNEVVDVRYFVSKNVDNIVIDAEKFPSSYKLVLRAKLFKSEQGQTQTGELQITIPQFKPQGNFEISLNMNDPATSSLEGRALATKRNGQDIYADVTIIPLDGGSSNQVVQIATTPATATLAVAETVQLQTIGIRGNGLGNVVNPSGTTYATSDAAIATVDANTGLVTAVATGSCVITATNGVLTDVTNITVS